MCCHRIGLLPCAGLKNGTPSVRSRKSAETAAARTVVATMTSGVVASCAHTKSGIRVNVMPGARIFQMVTKKLIPVSVEEIPVTKIARHQSDVPGGPASESGGYSTQPPSGAPIRNDENIITPATGNSQ